MRSIKAALEPVKFFEGIGERGCDVGSRLAVQTLNLDKPGTSGRIPERAFKVSNGLRVVVGTLPTSSLTPCDCQPSESDVVHDHILLRQHQMVAIARIGVLIGSRHVDHAGPTEGRRDCGQLVVRQ
jgi:hypothetical protein